MHAYVCIIHYYHSVDAPVHSPCRLSLAVYHRPRVLCHHAVLSARARLFVTTGTPVAPHSYEGLAGLKVYSRWVMVPPETFEDVNLEPGADTIEGFCRQFCCEAPPEAM